MNGQERLDCGGLGLVQLGRGILAQPGEDGLETGRGLGMVGTRIVLGEDRDG